MKEMERNGWVGVCCEPNLVFVACNQFPVSSLNYECLELLLTLIDHCYAPQ